jgi:ParB family chromosome partitioning protein
MVIENEHRQDISSWAKALSYKKALDRKIFPSQAALAAHLGIDRSALTNILVYTRIPEPLALAIGSFTKVGIHTARALLTLSEDKDNHAPILALATKIASGEIGAKRLTRAVAKARSQFTQNTPSSVLSETGTRIFSFRRTAPGAVQILLPGDVISRFTDDELKQRLASVLS